MLAQYGCDKFDCISEKMKDIHRFLQKYYDLN